MTNLVEGYSEKPERYFSGARRTFIDDLPHNPQARLLEIGCGNGDTAAYAKTSGKCGWTTGVELCAEPAVEAAEQLDEVLVGDIEQVTVSHPNGHFDVLIMSEVLEHIRDPWAVLRKLHPLLKQGAIVLAGSPNVSHWSVIKMLFRGRWDHEATGIMDRTHLRWFTPLTYRAMFEDCGFTVQSSRPAMPLRAKARCLNWLTFCRFEHLLHSQIYLKAIRR